MKHIVKVFALMLLLNATQQKAFSQTELKIHDGTVNPICKDSTKAPKDLMSLAIAIQENKVSDFFQPGVSNVEWAEKVVEGFNYRSAERLGMEPITIGQLMKMMKDTAHCKIKYLNVQKDLLLNSGVDPATGEIVWVKMMKDLKATPFITYESPYNQQVAVISKWLECINAQADLRQAKPEENLADNDDVYFTPDENEGISESSGDATAHADANAEAKVVVEYVPQGATNFQQYSQPCGCYQPYYPPPQQYYYTPSYNSGLFFGVQILFTFQWGGQTYNAYDPNDQVVQNIVNNYVTNNYIVNNYGTSDSTSTDTGGATNGNDGDDGGVVDNGGATNGTDGGAANGNDGGRQSDPNANQNDYVVETLDANPVSNIHLNQTHQASSLDGSGIASNVGNSVHNAQTLDANPVLANVNGSGHPVATLSGNGNPISSVNGVNHNVTNLDPNPTLASNSSNQNVSYSGNSQNGNNGYTASTANGTSNPTNYSQGVHTYSNGSQLQTTYTNPQGQMYGQNVGYSVSNPVAVNNSGNIGNGTYQNYNPNYNVPAVNTNGNVGNGYYNPNYNTNITSTGNTNGYANSIPRGNISYNPQTNGNVQQYTPYVPATNFSAGNTGMMNYQQPRSSLNFSQAPRFNLAPSVQKASFAGMRTF